MNAFSQQEKDYGCKRLPEQLKDNLVNLGKEWRINARENLRRMGVAPIFFENEREDTR